LSDKKITDLQLRANVTADLNFPSDDSLQSYRVTGQQIKDFVLPDAGLAGSKLAPTVITGQTYDTEPALLDSLLTYDSSAAGLKKTTLADLTSLMKARNLLDNAEFRFFQRQAPGTLKDKNTNSIGPDRWNCLTSGTLLATARVAEIFGTSPSRNIAQFRQRDSTARQIGTLQILEAEDVIGLRGKKVTFSFWARTDGVEVPNIRAGVMEWTGTADSPTRQPISAWSATPTLGTNWAFKNTPADIPLTGTMQKFSITVTLGTTFNNLAVMIWTPTAVAQDADFYLGQAAFVDYTEPIPFVNLRLSYDDDLRRCQRFYEKSYNVDSALETISLNDSHAWGGIGRAGRPATTIYFKATKRVIPSIGLFNPNTAATSTPIIDTNTGTSYGTNGAPNSNQWGFSVLPSGTPAIDAVLYTHWHADAEIGV
jgi:hypothetical protein